MQKVKEKYLVISYCADFVFNPAIYYCNTMQEAKEEIKRLTKQVSKYKIGFTYKPVIYKLVDKKEYIDESS